jgi:hypothetical protein
MVFYYKRPYAILKVLKMRIVLVGEVMAELRSSGGGYAVGFAVDAVNMAVYCRRLSKAHTYHMPFRHNACDPVAGNARDAPGQNPRGEKPARSVRIRLKLSP